MKSSFYTAFVLLLSMSSVSAIAQQTISSSGKWTSSGSGSISYTVGQIDYGFTSSPYGSVSQGVQHAYEIWVVSVTENYESINLVFSVYPNPTIDFLDLQIQNYNQTNMSYQLFDLNGKIMGAQTIDYSVTRISMMSLATSTYFLRVLENNNTIKIFKIIKQ